jgi:hypothetical protein
MIAIQSGNPLRCFRSRKAAAPLKHKYIASALFPFAGFAAETPAHHVILSTGGCQPSPKLEACRPRISSGCGMMAAIRLPFARPPRIGRPHIPNTPFESRHPHQLTFLAGFERQQPPSAIVVPMSLRPLGSPPYRIRDTSALRMDHLGYLFTFLKGKMTRHHGDSVQKGLFCKTTLSNIPVMFSPIVVFALVAFQF